MVPSPLTGQSGTGVPVPITRASHGRSEDCEQQDPSARESGGLEGVCSGPSPLWSPLFHPTFGRTWHGPAPKPSEPVSLCWVVSGQSPILPKAPLPLPARNPSPCSEDNRGVLQTLGARRTEKPKRPLNRGLSATHRQSEAAFVSKRRRVWARERSLPAAPGEELVGSEGTFQSLRCIDKPRPPQPSRRPGDQRGLRLLGEVRRASKAGWPQSEGRSRPPADRPEKNSQISWTEQGARGRAAREVGWGLR